MKRFAMACMALIGMMMSISSVADTPQALRKRAQELHQQRNELQKEIQRLEGMAKILENKDSIKDALASSSKQ